MKKTLILLAVTLCGANAFTDDFSRINNGNNAAIDQFPYSVSLQRLSQIQTAERGHKCGGALITLQHVLTAAYCLFDTVNGVPVAINSAEFRIFGGAALLTGDNDPNRIRTIANYTVHPDYIQPPASLNNIAIITLSTPFLNTTVQPINLPIDNFNPLDFTLCQIASWGGQNVTATASYTLRYTTKYVYNQNLCTSLYNQFPSFPNIFDTMVCAASYDIVSSGCTGDEGIALVCSGGLTGIMIQTNGCTVASYPEIYTRVSNYTTWIRSITGGSSVIRPELTFFAILAIVTAAFFNKA